MATTALVSEILILGFEAEAWLAVLVLSVSGTEWVDLGGLKGWEALVTILVLGLAYLLGILVDRLADSSARLIPWLDQPRLGWKRLEILHRSPGMSPFLEYQRSRLRIVRGTLFNAIPAGISAAIFVVWRTDGEWWLLAVFGATAVVVAATAFATYRIGGAYRKRLLQAHELVTSDASPSEASRSRDARPVVAAVCYGRRDREVEFLLVRTRGGDKWTFPKGHVEEGESAPDAAAREAYEEAGATGVVAGQPFMSYVYASGSDRRGERMVAAYLLEVAATADPQDRERRRDPTWFAPAAAKERLGEGGRQRRYAEAHAHVIDRALAELSARSGEHA